jgi:hypothetical protein
VEEPSFCLGVRGRGGSTRSARLIDADPATAGKLQELLAAKGLDIEQLDESLRTAALATQILEKAPGGIEEIEHAIQRASEFAEIDNAFTELKAGDVPSTVKFLQGLEKFSWILKEDGSGPELDPQGRPKTDGTLYTFCENIRDVALDEVKFVCGNLAKGDEAQKALGEEGIYALSVLDKIIKGQSGEPVELTEAQKVEQGKIDTQRQELAETRNQQDAADLQTFKEKVKTGANAVVNPVIEAGLALTNAGPAIKEAITKKIRDAIFEDLMKSTLFTDRQNQKSRMGLRDSTVEKMVAMYKTPSTSSYKKVAPAIYKEFGVEIVAASERRKAKITTQLEASRQEPTRSGAAARPAAPVAGDPHALVAKARENLHARGEDINVDTLLAERRRLMTEAKAVTA